MLPRKNSANRSGNMCAALTSAIVEWLWAGFECELTDLACPCGCSWDSSIWQYRDAPDDLMYDHLDMDEVDPEPVTRLENHWRHYSRWGHDGRNPLGGKSAALPTWKDRTYTGRARP